MSSRSRQAAELVAAGVVVASALVIARRLWERQQPPPSDAELLETLRRRLRSGLDILPNTVEVTVCEGVVELLGEVDTPEVADELERRAARTPGVVRVESFLSLPEAPVR
jgi:osmotically-inducible protein OsmY